MRRPGRALRNAALWLATTASVMTPAAAGQPAAQTAPTAPAVYQPVDDDERGLWKQMDEVERERKTSPLVIREDELNRYVNKVLCRTVGPVKCANARIYLVRTPQFNATMAPNGMMEVWSGLLLRVENEAQLAAVLAHEYTHFEQRHSVRLFRNIKDKTNAAGWLNLIPFGGLVGLGLVTSIFGFNREMEREADAGSVGLLAAAGYDTAEIAVIWERLREEQDRTAAERKTKSRKDKDGGLFATHPPSKERVDSLRAAAAANRGAVGANGLAEYRDALRWHFPDFVEDQLKMNDFGASEFLLESLAQEGWTPDLLYARGELYRRQGDAARLKQAADFFSQAIAAGTSLPEAWRGRGIALTKLGQAEAGRADLKEYLRRSPDASDAKMIAMMAGA